MSSELPVHFPQLLSHFSPSQETHSDHPVSLCPESPVFPGRSTKSLFLYFHVPVSEVGFTGQGYQDLRQERNSKL